MWNICCFKSGGGDRKWTLVFLVFCLLFLVCCCHLSREDFAFVFIHSHTELRAASGCEAAPLEQAPAVEVPCLRALKWGPNIPPCLCPGKLSACELWPLLLPSILLRRTSPLFYSLVCELGHSGFEHLGFFQNFSDGFHETIDSSCVSAQLQSLLSVKYQFSDVMGDEPSSFNRNSEIEMITLNHFWSLRAALTNTPYCAFISLTLVYPGEVWKAAMITYWLKFRAAAKKTVTPALVVSKLPPLTPDNNNISPGFVYPPRHLVVQRFLFFFSGINVVFQSQESAWMKLNMSQRSIMIVIDYLNKRWKYMTEDTNLN